LKLRPFFASRQTEMIAYQIPVWLDGNPKRLELRLLVRCGLERQSVAVKGAQSYDRKEALNYGEVRHVKEDGIGDAELDQRHSGILRT